MSFLPAATRPGPCKALVLAALVSSVWTGAAAAQKTDQLTLINGDRITGEIKGMSRGKLDYSTDDAGRLSIEWVKVFRLTSRYVFELECASGARYVGRLAESGQDGMLVVEFAGQDTLPITSVVRIDRLSSGFFQRVQAYLDLGFSFAKANSATTLSLSTMGEYRGPKLGTSLTYDSYLQSNETTPTTTRNTLAWDGTRYLPNRWGAQLLVQAEQNDELDLALRLVGGGGVGRTLKQSNSGELAAGIGLVATREHFESSSDGTVTDTTKTNLEGLIVGSWEAYRFDSPKLDLSTSLTLYPSLTTLGRVRGAFSLRFKYEVFSDFNVGINFTDTFDSRPPDDSVEKNDYVTSLTIGWSYRR